MRFEWLEASRVGRILTSDSDGRLRSQRRTPEAITALATSHHSLYSHSQATRSGLEPCTRDQRTCEAITALPRALHKRRQPTATRKPNDTLAKPLQHYPEPCTSDHSLQESLPSLQEPLTHSQAVTATRKPMGAITALPRALHK